MSYYLHSSFNSEISGPYGAEEILLKYFWGRIADDCQLSEDQETWYGVREWLPTLNEESELTEEDLEEDPNTAIDETSTEDSLEEEAVVDEGNKNKEKIAIIMAELKKRSIVLFAFLKKTSIALFEILKKGSIAAREKYIEYKARADERSAQDSYENETAQNKAAWIADLKKGLNTLFALLNVLIILGAVGAFVWVFIL